MRYRSVLLLAANAAALLGCSPHALSPITRETPVAAAPSPILRQTETPAERTDKGAVERHARIIAAAAEGGHHVAFLGASIIERWASVGAANWNAVWAGEPYHAVDCGIGGDRTQHVLWRLDHGLLDALAAPHNDIRWVVLNIGSNNTDVNDGEEIADGTRAIIARLRVRLPRARIILLALFPRGRWPNPLRDTIRSANTHLAMFAAADPDHIVMLDVGDRFLEPSGELPSVRMPDFLHPAANEYQWLSDEVERAMQTAERAPAHR